MKTPLLTLLLAAFTSPAFAATKPMPPSVFYIKMQKRLTGGGSWPTPEELTELKTEMARRNCDKVECMDDFFRKKIAAIMETRAFYSEMILKVNEKMNLKVPSNPKNFFVGESGSIVQDEVSGMIYRVFSQDLPFDTLFTGQIRWISKTDSSPFSSFSRTDIEPVGDAAKKAEVNVAVPGGDLPAFEEDFTGHPNFAGIFTTNRFLNRYWNSPVNQSRKRAAAVFQTLLCDSMSPALERMGQVDREHRLALGLPDFASKEREIGELHKNKHASQADCMKCHTRLDPVATTMRPLELGISNKPFAGRLRYFTSLNESVDRPVQSFHDLITQITKENKYVDCQVAWMTEKFIGRDLDISPKRYAELVKTFEAKGRRVKSFITELMMSPEFRGEQTPYKEAASFKNAKEVLSNCFECHSNFIRQIGSFKTKLQKISQRLDLGGDGKNRTMPPKTHWWDLSSEEIATIKSWLQEGAPVAEGEPLLEQNEVNLILNRGAK